MGDDDDDDDDEHDGLPSLELPQGVPMEGGSGEAHAAGGAGAGDNTFHAKSNWYPNFN